MGNNNLLIGFASYMAHVINGDDDLSADIEVVRFRAWELHQKIIDLLSYPQYKTHKKRAYQNTPEYLYCLVGHQMATDQTSEISVARYFELVFEYIISNKKQIAEPPTHKLSALFHKHRLNRALMRYKADQDTSLWRIFEEAGKSKSGEAVMYQRWKEGEFIALCQHISDVFRTANRHYGEIFRMGLYPPDWIEIINVSQARKINQLIQPKRDANYENLEWIEESRKLWDKYPIKMIDNVKLNSFDDFLETELGKCLTGRSLGKAIIISDYDFAQESNQDDEFYNPNYDVAYDCNLRMKRLQQLLNTIEINQQDKKIILQVIHNQDLSLDALPIRKRFIALGLDDEEAYLEYLGELIYDLLSS